MTTQKFSLLLIGFCLATFSMVAAPRSKTLMRQAAANAINQHRVAKKMAPRAGALKVLKTGSNYEILGYDKGGFAVVSADDLVPEVLGVSDAEYSEGRNPNFQWWLNAVDEVVSYAVQNNVQLKTTVPDPTKYPTSVEPMMTSKWDQVTPYNNMCPTYEGSVKCLTGCVATALAQVLYYHKTPACGMGQHTIYYPYGVSTGEAVTANFAEDNYDWEHMLDEYTAGPYTREEANAVALLMRDLGVAVDMEYGGPSEGSGAYSQNAAKGLRRYFGFEDAECLERSNYSESLWMDRVYRELSQNGPLYYGGSDSSQGGHAFVLHGYRADGMVYVNWGWSGDDDGYYDIAILDPSYYQFSYWQDMIAGVTSSTHLNLRNVTVSIDEIGQLQQTVEALEDEGQIGILTVNGPLSQEDLYYLRQLAGRDSLGRQTEGKLHTLKLTNAALPQNSLPDSIFKNCITLRNVQLPVTIEKIGGEAFSGCRNLMSLRIPSRQVPKLEGTNVFRDLPFGMATLYVRSSMKTKYLQAAQWKDFGSKGIVEFGTSLKVRNAIRYYGEQNPQFIYIVNGDPIQGTPELTCEATAESPAGRYPVVITRGTVKGEDIDFIDGYLIVQKVKATATVGSYTREQGQPNPAFELVSYDGLVAGDTAPVWLTEPVFVTTADENSPVGEYPIIVESAVAESYQMTFVPGTLTVTKVTGIQGLSASETDSKVVRMLDGRQLKGTPRKGIYIVDGKKVIVK